MLSQRVRSPGRDIESGEESVMDTTTTIRRPQAKPSAIVTVLRAPIFWQLATLVLLGFLIRYWLGTHRGSGDVIAQWGVVAPLVLVLLQAVSSVTPMGTSLIPMVNGALFPLPFAIALNVAGGVIGGTCMYYVWQRGERELQLREKLDRLPRWTHRFARGNLLSLVLLRYLPWAGGTVANLIAGTQRVPLRIHVLSVALGSVPGSLFYAYLGAKVALM